MGKKTREFDDRFKALHERWRALIERAGWPSEASPFLIRSAAKVEQTFGGINSKLWDDPFEWTLPEALGSEEKAFEYLGEVETARREGIARIRSDSELDREIWSPTGVISLSNLLARTLLESEALTEKAESKLDITTGQA